MRRLSLERATASPNPPNFFVPPPNPPKCAVNLPADTKKAAGLPHRYLAEN
jgi:hypothetical protein